MEIIEKSEFKIVGVLVVQINVIRHGIFSDLTNNVEIDEAINWLNGFRKN
jgi:hypothetical protein